MQEDPLTGQVDGLEAAYIVGSQFKNGSDTSGRQNLLQEMAGTKTPHQTGELALCRRRPHVPVNGAHHRRVGGARAARSTVDVVELQKKTRRRRRDKDSNSC